MRFVAGSLLLVAAVLKAVSPAESAALEAAYGLPGWFSIALVAGEWVLGTLLVAGLWPRRTTNVAAVVFLAFAAFALYRGWSGAESCGCFGAVMVNPWWTFVLDVSVAAALGRDWWRSRAQGSRADATSCASGRARMAVAGACVLAGVPIFGWAVSAAPQRLSPDAVLAETGGLILLEPETWPGKPFPLMPYVETSADLTRGEWVVLLYHHDCPKCQQAVPRYVQLAEQLAAADRGVRVLLVEVPPFGRECLALGAAQGARLSAEQAWFVQAPVEIRLREAKVVAYTLELPALAELSPPDAELSRWASFEP